MKIITFSYPNIPITEEKIALCLGYFDGVHLGHQRIIQKALDEGYKVGILTLDSSPAFILGRIKENHNLTSLSDRADYFEKLGVDYFYIMHFDKEVCELDKKDFIQEILQVLNPVKIYCGEDYTFGKNGEGTPEFLSYFFNVKVIPLLKIDGQKVAARDIWRFVEEGKMREAAKLLSRYYRINGLVVEGKHNGKKIDYPTANIQMDYPYVFPKIGVYAGYTDVYGKRYKSIISVGTHPTIMQLMKPIIEVHLLDYDGNLYGKDIFVDFVEYIRDEQTFASLEELKIQIHKDERVARKILLDE